MAFIRDLFSKLDDALYRWAQRRRVCEHRWQVVGTALADVSLEMCCKKCGLWGSVKDPTEHEWTAAYNARENPYDWNEPDRVESAWADVDEMLDEWKKIQSKS